MCQAVKHSRNIYIDCWHALLRILYMIPYSLARLLYSKKAFGLHCRSRAFCRYSTISVPDHGEKVTRCSRSNLLLYLWINTRSIYIHILKAGRSATQVNTILFVHRVMVTSTHVKPRLKRPYHKEDKHLCIFCVFL